MVAACRLTNYNCCWNTNDRLYVSRKLTIKKKRKERIFFHVSALIVAVVLYFATDIIRFWCAWWKSLQIDLYTNPVLIKSFWNLSWGVSVCVYKDEGIPFRMVLMFPTSATLLWVYAFKSMCRKQNLFIKWNWFYRINSMLFRRFYVALIIISGLILFCILCVFRLENACFIGAENKQIAWNSTLEKVWTCSKADWVLSFINR